MIVASTLIALPLLAVALVARRLRSDLEETAWRLMAVAMLVLPVTAFLPKVDVGFVIPFVGPEPSFTLLEPRELPTDSGLPVLAIVYAAIAGLLFARLAIAAATAWKLRRDARPFGGAWLAPSLRVPVTAGLVAPAILLPADAPSWSAAKLAAVLAHERAHVGRRDPLWRFIGRAAVALCWFHPLAWLAASSIERIAEETADREAVAATGDRHEYANVLLDLLRAMTGSHRRFAAVGMLDGRAIGTRIDSILQPARTRRSSHGTRLLLTALVAAAIFLTGMTGYESPPADVPGIEQQLTAEDLEFFRKRDELRNRFREQMRETARAIAGSFFN
jgi:hypothetical protein